MSSQTGSVCKILSFSGENGEAVGLRVALTEESAVELRIMTSISLL